MSSMNFYQVEYLNLKDMKHYLINVEAISDVEAAIIIHKRFRCTVIKTILLPEKPEAYIHYGK